MMPETNIQLLLNSGFDAFSNLYKVQFTLIPTSVGTDGSTTFPEIRIKDFKAPTLALGEYEQHFKTISLTRVNAQFVGDREFELTFRIDDNWTLYNSLKSWRKLYVDVGKDAVYMGLHSNSPSYPQGEVKVSVFKGNTLQNGTVNSDYSTSVYWNFKNVILYEMTEPSFSRASSAPIEITCKFLFGEYKSTTSEIV
jgi:hypothetical protein